MNNIMTHKKYTYTGEAEYIAYVRNHKGTYTMIVGSFPSRYLATKAAKQFLKALVSHSSAFKL